jgi:hypothetical protein
MTSSIVLLLSALLLAPGMVAHDADAQAAGRGAPPATKQPAPRWYHRSVTRDLNGDARPDSAVLSARGRRPDSLSVALVFFVSGREVYREEWESDYELIDLELPERTPKRLAAYVRTRFDRTLAGLTVEPLDTAEARLMADDPDVLSQVTPLPRTQLSFSYGYESTIVLIWDARRRKFVLLWGCC